MCSHQAFVTSGVERSRCHTRHLSNLQAACAPNIRWILHCEIRWLEIVCKPVASWQDRALQFAEQGKRPGSEPVIADWGRTSETRASTQCPADCPQ